MATDHDRGQYEPVPTSEAASAEGRRRRRQRRETIEAISNKIHALLWVIGAGLVLFLTDFFTVLFTDERVSWFWLDLALLCSGVFIAAGVYLTVYLPLIAQVHAPWEVYCPNVIPVATAAGVVAFISYAAALWPVFAFLTLPILGILFVGFLMLMQFIPVCY
ncbi:TMEM128 [Symbiodinium sp. KB8]|nr:TMEM128 [Symbiodinium sp. KB8]